MANKNKERYTLEDVANILGVSKTTVSRAISGKGRIGSATREKVLNFIQENNYRPNVIAKGLAQKKTYNIGLALPEELKAWDSPFCQKIINGICEVASQHDYDLILLYISQDNTAQLQRIVDNHKADGIILTRTMVKDAPISYLQSKTMPFVVIGSSDDNSVTHVDNNHIEACQTLMELLISRGLKDYALIGGESDLCVTNSRLEGYKRAISKDSKNITSKVYLDASTLIQITKIVDKIIENKNDCIVCMDDYICSTVMTYLDKLGLSVPDDISIATFYRSIMLESYHTPITGLEFDEKNLGGITCDLLIKKLNGDKVEDYLHTDYRLFMGKSIK